jgi:hypothetical protein
MDSAVLTATVSGSAAIMTVVLAYPLTRRRERWADLRKLTLETDEEDGVASSGIVDGRNPTAEAHARYTNAANAMNLVASPAVLRALQADLAACSFKYPARRVERHDKLLKHLPRSMRRDINPSFGWTHSDRSFRLMTDPPAPSNSTPP